MIAQSVKPSVKSLNQKGEVSLNKKKSRLGSKSKFSSCKAKPETSSYGKTSADVSLLHCIGRPLEDSHLKFKLLQMTPQSPTNETSQGVQDFMEHVSKFIEQKNPFVVEPEKKFHRDSRKAGNVPRMRRSDSKIFNFDKNSENYTFKHYSQKSKTLDKPKRILASTDVTRTKAVEPADKRLQMGLSNASPEARKPDEPQRVRRLVGGNLANHWKDREAKAINLESSPGSEENGEARSNPSAFRPTQCKKKGRSEIPLRITRTDLSRHPKPLSLLMQKPLKEIESAISIDLFSKKPFTPIEELSFGSEVQIQNVNAHGTSEKADNAVTKRKDIQRAKRKDILPEEVSGIFKLDRCFKSPNIPIVTNPSLFDVTDIKQHDNEDDKKSSSAKRSKVLDLNKVRTSSFTILQTNREVLCRLESLHQQNVSNRESVFGEKLNSSKLKVLNRKPSFNLLKGKCSKKNLLSRSSSKGNKPALKIKSKKSKKDIDESLILLKKSQKTNSKARLLEIDSKVTKPKTCIDLDFLKDEKLAKDELKSSWKLSEYNSTDNSSLKSRSREKAKETCSGKELSALEKSKKFVSKGVFDEFGKELSSSRNANKKAAGFFDIGKVKENKSNGSVEVPPVPPHTPEKESHVTKVTVLEPSSPYARQADEDERSSSKTVTLEGGRVDEVSSQSSEGSHTKKSQPLAKKSSKVCEEADLTVKGTSLNIEKDEPPEKPEGSESKKNELHIKINLTSAEDTDCEEIINNNQSFDWLYLNKNKYIENPPPHEEDSNDLTNTKEETFEGSLNEALDSLSAENAEEQEENESFCSTVDRKSSPFIKNRSQYKISGANLKGVRKSIRSNAGDRCLASSTRFFKSVSLQNKLKLDTKLRSGLTKSCPREEKRDLFEDAFPIKLKRRNSEPISFRGYIWKHADSVTPRGHKASVSSMASSLKHLNTDDIDDFIFWEAVPQKMSSCWEMSLYHFKRPWSVLSCSVFKDNRQSSTPGLILENLRNGANLSPRRSALNSNEGGNRLKENPFDVEPSIAQKNIDIRNWLAALNFPTPPSTSADVISEGNFMQSPVHVHLDLNKSQVNQKRRRVPTSLKSEEATEKKGEEKENKLKRSTKWKANEVGGLMDLIRRKSGSFVTNEQFLNSEHLNHRPNVTVNLCLYSKAAEEKPILREAKERNVSSEPKTFKTAVKRPPVEAKKPESLPDEVPRSGGQPIVENDSVKEAPLEMIQVQKPSWVKLLKGELRTVPSDLNVWKYLFLFTLLIISVHYCFLNNSVGRS